MNPRLLWLLALIMTVNVAGLAQTYNATFNNAPAETAIQILKKVTGHDFVYQKELIKTTRPPSRAPIATQRSTSSLTRP